MSEVTACGGCGSTWLESLFDMGRQPLPETPGSARYPLGLVQCKACLLVQSSYIVDQAELFPPRHPYSTGNSSVLRRHYGDMARQLAGNLLVGDVVVDIGANDGTLLKAYPDNLIRVAIEPTNQIERCGPGIHQYRAFFTAKLAQHIREERGPASVITACNVLAHVPDVHDFLDGVATLLDDDGVFVTENHDLASVTEELQIDTIYHEHLRYYSVATLTRLLELHGLRTISSQQVVTHGGSFQVRARRMHEGWQRHAEGVAAALRGMLWKIVIAEKQKVYGISAATRATPIIHYAGISQFLTCVCEVAGSDKIGKVIPGTQIPIVDESALVKDQPPYAVLFAWHMASDIVPKLRAAGYRGEIIVPLPAPKVLNG